MISYRGGVKKIKVEDLDILLNINEIQKIDLEKLFKINLEKDDLENYGVDNSSFTREINLKKSQGNNIIPPQHQLREQKKNMPERYCISCRAKQKMDDLRKVTLRNGRKALEGKFPSVAQKCLSLLKDEKKNK